MSQHQLQEDTIAKLAQKGRESLFFLTRAILGFDKMTKSIHLPICKDFEDYVGNKRLLIMLPRDWYKTTLGSISYSIWRAINDPEIRILIVQNTYTNAVGKLAAIKQIFEKNELFRACYPEILPTTKCTWSREALCVNRKGTVPESTFEAAGTATAVVSRHYDVIIEDDTVAPDFDNITGALMQPTQAEIEKCIGWHKLAHPLLIEPALSQIVVIGTRWVEGDLLEWIMKNEPQYKVIERAVREDEDGRPDPLGKIVWEETDDGVPKFNSEVLQQLEAALGPYMYSALYMNMPTSASDMLFKRTWINYYTTLPDNLLFCTSQDPSSGDADMTSDPDYDAVVTTGINPHNGHIYVIHYNRERMNPGEQVSVIFDHYRAYKSLRFYLEAISYQRTLAYWIRKRMTQENVFFPIEEIRSHKSSKVDRIRGLQPYFSATRIFIKADMPELENELLSFPHGRHDDVIDALSMQLPFWSDIVEEVKPKYTRTYMPGSAAFLIDSIRKRWTKNKKFPNDMGNMADREPVTSAFMGTGLRNRFKEFIDFNK